MRFFDRAEAAALLAQRLTSYTGRRPLVLGVPRGGVPMARALAQALGGDLDVVLVHKLRAPGHEELALGAVDESGRVLLTDEARAAGVTEAQLDSEVAEQRRVMARRRKEYTPLRTALDPSGRLVIIVDDGIATGSTMLAAIRAIRARGPGRIVVATPVAPPDAVARLAAEADEVVCLYMPREFFAVGQFYDHFGAVSDEAVRAALGPFEPGVSGGPAARP
ncbi:MAG: phosphoribosyltransferase [Vicinamibacterales bacterium]